LEIKKPRRKRGAVPYKEIIARWQMGWKAKFSVRGEVEFGF
jgi:hypothetical protein